MTHSFLRGVEDMISCTEFIPAYSELFKFIDKKSRRQAVYDYWETLFDPDIAPLNSYLEKYGLAGCYHYWSHTLNEEAADFSFTLDEEEGYFKNEMRYCPSKGRLLELKHIEPFDEYCRHCDYYRLSAEKHGLVYEYDFSNCDKAQCSMLIYDPKTYKHGSEKKTSSNSKKLVMDRRASDNKYLHKDFHCSLNHGIQFIAEKYGYEGLIEYLTDFAKSFYSPLIADTKTRGLSAIKEHIERIYGIEEASDSLKIVSRPDGLEIYIAKCPAVEHIVKCGITLSKWFIETTATVFRVIAEESGARFELYSYEEDTGKAHYGFKSVK